nr:hypothetical protein [Pedobacter sp. JY14-1]
MSKLVDVTTSPVSDRIAVMNEFREVGYEVNVIFAPVIYYEAWLDGWKPLYYGILRPKMYFGNRIFSR